MPKSLRAFARLRQQRPHRRPVRLSVGHRKPVTDQLRSPCGTNTELCSFSVFLASRSLQRVMWSGARKDPRTSPKRPPSPPAEVAGLHVHVASDSGAMPVFHELLCPHFQTYQQPSNYTKGGAVPPLPLAGLPLLLLAAPAPPQNSCSTSQQPPQQLRCQQPAAEFPASPLITGRSPPPFDAAYGAREQLSPFRSAPLQQQQGPLRSPPTLLPPGEHDDFDVDDNEYCISIRHSGASCIAASPWPRGGAAAAAQQGAECGRRVASAAQLGFADADGGGAVSSDGDDAKPPQDQ